MGAPPKNCDTRSTSSVAEVTMSFNSGRRGSNRLDTSRVRIDWASNLIYRALGDDECATVDEGGNLYEVAIG